MKISQKKNMEGTKFPGCYREFSRTQAKVDVVSENFKNSESTCKWLHSNAMGIMQ